MKNKPWKQILHAPIQLIQFVFEILLKIVEAPFKTIGRLFSRNPANLKAYDEAYGGGKSKKSFFQNARSTLAEVLRFTWHCILQTLAFPFRFIKHLFANARVELLWCLPAMLLVVFVAFVCFRVVMQKSSILRLYRLGASQAMAAEDFDLAKTYYQRLVSWPGDVRQSDRLNWALCLQNTGQPALAANIVNELAPDDKPGSPAAHRLKAISISRRLTQTHEPELCESLIWHLKNSGDNESEEIRVAYAVYYIETGQLDRAARELEATAKQNPAHYLTLARIHQQQNDELAKINALRSAEQGFRTILENNPLSNPVRIAMASSLVQQEKLAEAEQVLMRGYELKKDQNIQRALADFYLMLHDKSKDFSEKLALIQKSLDYDINYLAAYQRVLDHFTKRLASDPAKAQEVEQLLLSSIASGQSTALAHFTLSNLLSKKEEHEEAQWHIEKAYALDPSFTAVANNLAWMLAHAENPDLDRAFELASDVVRRLPNDPRMRDTLATILFKQEKWEEALVQFEMVLGKTENRLPIHKKLAIIYERLGKPRLAELHRNNAAELEK